MAKGIHSRPQNMAKVLEGLAKHGINIDLNMVQEVVDNGPQQRALAQEAMLHTLAVKPPKLIQRECEECKETFGTNYLYVGYCSDHCRRVALKRIGIHYSAQKNEYTARQEEAMVVPPSAIKALRELLSIIVSPCNVKVDHQEPGYIPGQLSLFEMEEIPSSPGQVLHDMDVLHRQLGIAPQTQKKKSKSTHTVSSLNKELDELFAGLEI